MIEPKDQPHFPKRPATTHFPSPLIIIPSHPGNSVDRQSRELSSPENKVKNHNKKDGAKANIHLLSFYDEAISQIQSLHTCEKACHTAKAL
jgi:hypothetical protein